MNALRKRLTDFVVEIRSNKRLSYGLVVIVAVICVEGGMRWMDWVAQQQSELVQLQTDLLALRSNTRNEATLKEALVRAERLQEAIDTRLWLVASEAVGQARLKDWLTDVVKTALANQYAITLASSRELINAQTKGPPDLTNLREFRATLSFQFTPSALEKVLAEIEGGKPFSSIDNLLVKQRERRVELTVRVLMRVTDVPHV